VKKQQLAAMQVDDVKRNDSKKAAEVKKAKAKVKQQITKASKKTTTAKPVKGKKGKAATKKASPKKNIKGKNKETDRTTFRRVVTSPSGKLSALTTSPSLLSSDQLELKINEEVYEIPPDKTRTFYDNNYTYTNGEYQEIESICNHRKMHGSIGELLIIWDNQEVEWGNIDGVHLDLKIMKKLPLLYTYMQDNNLTFEIMGMTSPAAMNKWEDDQTQVPLEIIQKVIPMKDSIETNTSEAVLEPSNHEGSFEDGLDCLFEACKELDQVEGDESMLLLSPEVAQEATEEKNSTNKETEKESLSSPSSLTTRFECLLYEKHNDANFEEFDIEENAAYCGKTGDLYGTDCGRCDKLLKPSNKHPIFCCPNRAKGCRYAVCNECYKDVITKKEKPHLRNKVA
jgi:hypothetical protein